MGASNRVALCDLRVFVDQATEAVAAQNANTFHVGERMDAASRRALLQRPVGPVRIVMMDVLAQHQPQVLSRSKIGFGW